MSLDEILSTMQPAAQFAQARNLYSEFNRFKPGKVVKVSHRRIVPPIVVDLGPLLGLIYRSDKGQQGLPQAYLHLMENPPRLVCSIDGKQLYIVGGDYRVTSRGIEG